MEGLKKQNKTNTPNTKKSQMNTILPGNYPTCVEVKGTGVSGAGTSGAGMSAWTSTGC